MYRLAQMVSLRYDCSSTAYQEAHMNKKQMMELVFHQLAIDYNCSPDDFLKNEIIFTEAKELEGRRPYPFFTPRLELITFGNGMVINASSDILDKVKTLLKNKTTFEIFSMPFICGVNPYYLPEITHLSLIEKKDTFQFEFIEKPEIHQLYRLKDFDFALQYDVNSLHPEELAVVVKYNDTVVGIASAVAECKTMWQINVDVLSPFRGNNLATIAVNMLTIEVLSRGIIPYYSTGSSNVHSQRVAIKSGYVPAWSHCFRTRIDLLGQ